MILWDRNTGKISKTSSEDREELARQNCTKSFLRNVKRGNTIVNIAVPAGIFALCGFDLIALAAGFIATDIVLCCIDNEVFVRSPYRKAKKMSLEDVESRIERMKLQKDAKEKEISKLRSKYCSDCSSYSGWSRSECSDCETMSCLCSDVAKLRDFIQSEEHYLATEKGKIKDKEIENNNKKSAEYQNKLKYFEDMRDRLKYFIDKQNVEYLKPVHKALKKLINVLEEKEVGFTIISSSFYIYLDELQGILEKFFSLNSEQKSDYIGKIEKLSKLIEDHINSVVKRIEKLEVEDLEVNIDVLLQELERKAEENKDV